MAAVSERVNLLRPAGLPGSSLVVMDASVKPIRTHHEWFAFGVVWQGRRRFFCRGRSHRTSPRTLLAWEPGDHHHTFGRCEVAMTQRVLLLEERVFRGAAEECGGAPGPLHLRDNSFGDPDAFRAMTALARALERGSGRLESESLFLRFVAFVLERLTERGRRAEPYTPERAAVRRVRDHLHDSVERNVTLDELSALTGLGRYRLLRAFRREVGVPPHQYQIDLRVSRARRLMEQGCGAAEAAARAGFSDQSHFIRHFKRFAGLSPGRWFGGRPRSEARLPDVIDRGFLTCPSSG